MEEQQQSSQNHGSVSSRGKGGWITSPFILGSSLALIIANEGWLSNLILFLVKELKMKNIEAVQINNITTGFVFASPVVGAIITDSIFNGFALAIITSFISLLGLVMFTMMVTISSLRPDHDDGQSTSNLQQRAFLFVAVALGTIGIGGTRSIIGSLGAHQFEEAKHQRVFFNWSFAATYLGLVIGSSVLVYIQLNLSWALGFGIAMGMNLIGIALLVFGMPFFRHVTPQGMSPFVSIARVFVAAAINPTPKLIPISTTTVNAKEGQLQDIIDYDQDDCYYYDNPEYKTAYGPPTKSLRFLNRAAVKVATIAHDDHNVRTAPPNAKSWKLCSVEEVEDLKKLVRILPIWCFGILYNIPIQMNLSFVVLQALAMDTQVGVLKKHNFKIPPTSFVVFTLLLSCITIPVLDRILYPTWNRIFGRPLTPLQRVGVGHVCNSIAMAAFALIERKRLRLVMINNMAASDTDHMTMSMSALWLALPLALIGVGEAFEVPGESAFHFREFPRSLKNTSLAMVSLRMAMAAYLSAAITAFFHHKTSWLPDDINHGRLDNVYWTLSLIVSINFFCFLIYSKVYYKYNNP